MSRARRKTPIIGVTQARSEKQDKRTANHRLRAAVRSTSNLDLNLREVMDVWDMRKEGKHYHNDLRGTKWVRK
jgi:hypothetical protein